MIELPFIKSRLRLQWKYEATGRFWQIIPASYQYLVLEDRNTDEKVVEYAMLDYHSGKEYWRKSFSEKWWIGVETVCEGVIVYHGYATPELPEHKNILVVDLQTGNILWSDPNLKYLFCTSGNLVAERRTNLDITYVECEIQTGNIITEHDESSVMSLQQNSKIPVSKLFVYPESYEYNPPKSTSEIDILKKKMSGFKITEYIDVEGVIVLAGYYISSEINNRSIMNQEIVIINKEKNKIVFRDTITRSASYPVQGVFLYAGKTIIYLKEQKILNALEIK
jgi:hypothetical protein